MDKRKLGGVIAAMLIVILFFCMPAIESFSNQAVSAAGILLAALILWITEALPMSVTTMLMICVLSMEGIMPFNESMKNIGTSTAMFIMASSGITVAMAKSTLPQRMTTVLLKHLGNHASWLVISLGLLIAVCSAFMSSLATCALFACIVDAMLPKSASNMRRCIMLSIPACAGIGGFMSPAGTPANILLLDYLRQNGISLSFTQWCAIGFPVGLMASLIFLLSVLLIFRPTMPEFTITFSAEKAAPKDTVLGIILALVIAGWFASSWISWLSISEIAVIGLVLMFLPFIDILDWKTFSEGANWDLVITMGTVSVLMTGISRTGLIDRIAEILIWPIADLPPFVLLCAISVIICLIRAFIPTTTAVVTLLGPMLISIAQMTGQNIAVLLMILAFWTASALLLVYTEPIYLITFQLHDYKAKDLLLAGGIPSLLLSVLISILIPFLIQIIHVT